MSYGAASYGATAAYAATPSYGGSYGYGGLHGGMSAMDEKVIAEQKKDATTILENQASAQTDMLKHQYDAQIKMFQWRPSKSTRPPSFAGKKGRGRMAEFGGLQMMHDKMIGRALEYEEDQ
jgi:hypothetical protein